MERPYHHGDLRAALLEAVAAILREEGLSALSLRAVARRCGVSHAAPAHHFPTRAALLTAFATQGYQRLGGVMQEEIRTSRPPDGPALMKAMGRAYVRFAVAHPEQFELMFRSDLLDAADPAYAAATEATFQALVGAVRRGVAEGLLGEVDEEAVVFAAWSLVHGLAQLWIHGRVGARRPDADPNALAAAVTGLYVDGLLASARLGRR